MTLNPIFGKLFSELVSNGYIGNEPSLSILSEEGYVSNYFETSRGNIVEFREQVGLFSVSFYFPCDKEDFSLSMLAFSSEINVGITENTCLNIDYLRVCIGNVEILQL